MTDLRRRCSFLRGLTSFETLGTNVKAMGSLDKMSWIKQADKILPLKTLSNFQDYRLLPKAVALTWPIVLISVCNAWSCKYEAM